MNIYLTSKEYKKIKRRKLGEGLEGIVYLFERGILLKEYKALSVSFDSAIPLSISNYVIDEENLRSLAARRSSG